MPILFEPPAVWKPLAPLTAPGGVVGSAGVVTPAALGVTVFPYPTRALYVGGTGNVVVVMGGQTVTFNAVPTGTMLNIAVTQVLNTSTATLMVALD